MALLGAPYIYDISRLRVNIKMDDDTLKQVSILKYLGGIFTKDGRNKEDIIQRIKEAKIHHLPPWIRSFNLFRYRRVAIVFLGAHVLFFLEVGS
jgi:hypothetical protein